MSDIPDPGAVARTQARALLAEIGPAALHARLAETDPATAAGLYPSDGQRLARAWEVLTGTGKGLAAWHAESTPPASAGAFRSIMIEPPRAELRAAIAGRFAAMVAGGAVEEVAALLALHLDPALPAMRAHGVPELAAYLRGDIGLDEAERRACLATGQYTKRQATWFRHRKITPSAQTYTIVARISTSEQFSDSQMAGMQNFILAPVDASQHDA